MDITVNSACKETWRTDFVYTPVLLKLRPSARRRSVTGLIMIMMIMIALKGSIRDFFFFLSLLTAP